MPIELPCEHGMRRAGGHRPHAARSEIPADEIDRVRHLGSRQSIGIRHTRSAVTLAVRLRVPIDIGADRPAARADGIAVGDTRKLRALMWNRRFACDLDGSERLRE